MTGCMKWMHGCLDGWMPAAVAPPGRAPQGFRTLVDHAAYKYLLHVDGQGLSSRLEQLLPLRSLVLKEESGYAGACRGTCAGKGGGWGASYGYRDREGGAWSCPGDSRSSAGAQTGAKGERGLCLVDFSLLFGLQPI